MTMQGEKPFSILKTEGICRHKPERLREAHDLIDDIFPSKTMSAFR